MNLLDYFQNEQPRIVRLIQNLCEIESPSHDVEGSRAAVDLLTNEVEKLKCVDKCERITIENSGEHLIVRAFSNISEKPILLLGHTDTVHPRGSLRVNPFRVDDGKIFAPGIFDMKSGAWLMIEMLRAFDNLNLRPNRPITILLTCDEETGSDSGRAVVEREAAKAAFCLVLEPSANGAVKTGRKGIGVFNVNARGVPSHAGLEPEKGASAIVEIAKQIVEIQKLNDFDKGTTANVCLINGGTASNVIPEFATCAVDVRFTTMAEAARVETAIKNLQSFDDKVSLEITGEINRPPLERSTQILELYERARTIARNFDYDLRETTVGGASDGNFVAALGVPVLDGLGIAGDGAHTNHEHILASDIAPRTALIAALVLSLDKIKQRI